MPSNTVIDLNSSGGISNLPGVNVNTPTGTLTVPFGGAAYRYVDPFGFNSNPIAVYPNDVIQLNVYNAIQRYLETNFRIDTFVVNGTTITLDVERDLSDLGYISGRYRAEYKFFRNYLGSGDAHKLQIQEISADGLEIRVVPAVSSEFLNIDFLAYFSDGFFQQPKSLVLPNLFLHKTPTVSMRVFDYVQDKFTFPNTPYSIIFKLNAPAPTGVVIGDFLWLAQEVSETISDEIVIIPPKPVGTTINIAGPNWDALNNDYTSVTTQYSDWDDLLSTNVSTSQQIINSLLSSSYLEGIPLNIDYRLFDNFVTFGSAAERLYNFKYKMELLEMYNARIAQLTTGLTGLPSSSVTGSAYFQTNVTDARIKRDALVGSFDGYEKYLYYESSSYVTNSFGEFYPTTWPKSNTTLPYTNYSYSSSQVEDWFDGIIASASLYDTNNDKALYKLIPAHVLEDNSNDQYVLFTQMIGHYFDLMFAYVKQMTKVHHRDESLLDGFSKELVYHVSKNLGVDFENGSTLEELWSYMLGTDVTGSLVSTYGITMEDKTREIWKRIINNLPYLLKTKGTERGLRALINCFGIPSTILRIREYGGPEPSFYSATDYVYDRFNYALRTGIAGFSYYSTASYGYSYYSPFESSHFYVPWSPLENGLIPMSTQLRVRMHPNQTADQILIEVPNKWHIRTYKQNNYSYIGFFISGAYGWATASVSSSIYDNSFHSITLRRSSGSDVTTNNQTYELIVKRAEYEKVVSTQTASLHVAGAISSSYNQSFIDSGNLWVPGIPSSSNAYGIPFSGSVQEFRYWTKKLDNDILDNHTLAPTSFQGNTDGVYVGSTSSFYDLSVRFCLGSDNRKIDFSTTSSFASQHPNQDSTKFYNNISKVITFSGSQSEFYEPVVERHSLEWPDGGGVRSIGNKIRIDSVITTENMLHRDSSVERALSDNYPIDSARLGVYLSPTNEVNQDIAEQFGGLSMDDYIGDPTSLTLDYYPDLEVLKHEYRKKYKQFLKQQNYIRLLQYYDAALFKLIKKFVPYRANAIVGLAIESDVLHRSKLPSQLPSIETLMYSGSIVSNTMPMTATGSLEPVFTEGVIGNDPILRLIGDQQPVQTDEASINGVDLMPALEPIVYNYVVDSSIQPIDVLDIVGDCNEFNNTAVTNNPTSADRLYDEINLGETSYGRDSRLYGSQYIFMTYATSGSGVSASAPYWITSSRYDYYEPLNPTIMDSNYSQVSNVSNDVYDTDLYFGNAFRVTSSYGVLGSNINTIYTSSAAVQLNDWTSRYGLTIDSIYINNVLQSTPYGALSNTEYWGITGSLGLYYLVPDTTHNFTASIKIPAFFYNANDIHTHNYLYEVSIKTINQGNAHKMILYAGDVGVGPTQSLSFSNNTQTFRTIAQGSWLGISIFGARDPGVSYYVIIDSLKVRCLNYRAQVQDFHLRDSYGMRNARYDGCKLTSTGYNVNSPDTIDRGPVITVTVGGGTQLSVEPTTQGNFEIL